MTPHRTLVAPAAVAAAWLVLALGLTACGGDPEPRTLAPDDAPVAASATASLDGTVAEVMLPSGRARLVVTGPRDAVPVRDLADGAELVPADGAVLVGVAWSIDLGVPAHDPVLELVNPVLLTGPPADVVLRLVAGDDEVEVPDVGDLTGPGGDRPARAVWVAVPDDADLSLEVDYDGVTQSVAVPSGDITAGRAAALYGDPPRTREVVCEASDNYYCKLGFATGYPYVADLGWAAEGRTFMVTDSAPSGNDGALTVDSGEPLLVIDGSLDRFDVFEVEESGPVVLGGSYVVDGRETTVDAVLHLSGPVP